MSKAELVSTANCFNKEIFKIFEHVFISYVIIFLTIIYEFYWIEREEMEKQQILNGFYKWICKLQII